MFGLIGDAHFFMVDSFIKKEGGRFVAATHEAAAVPMADGYAETTVKTAVATITHGQGLTNADDLEVAAVAVTGRDRPVLIDLKLDPDRIPWT